MSSPGSTPFRARDWFRSVRFKLTAAFLALSFIAAALGEYAIYAITQAGEIVVHTYDGPLQGISYARESSLSFAQLESELLRQRFHQSDAASGIEALDALAVDFDENIRVAEERALSDMSRKAVQSAHALEAQWIALARKFVATPDVATAEKIDEVSAQVIAALDEGVELLTYEGFVERQKSVAAIATSKALAIGGTGAALILALVMAVILSRQIVKPLGAAASAANQIAAGAFDTKIPTGGSDETGALLRSMSVMQASIQTMMEREKAQRRSAQTRLVEALEGSPEGMMLVDSNNRIVLANEQVRVFFPMLQGVPLVDADFGYLFSDNGIPQGDARVASEGVDAESNPHGEIPLADGRWLHVSRSRTAEGGWFVFWSDITALKDREEKYRQARLEAEAASRAKSTFLANISHELRTPLNAIIGFSEIIKAQLFGPIGVNSYLEYAGDILSSGRHLLHVINDVLDISRSDAGTLELTRAPIDLCELARECADEVGPQCARANLNFDLNLTVSAAVISGDQLRLKQVLLNLLLNAIKFTPSGYVVLVVRETADDYALEVRDTGIGMRAEDIPRAMEAFVQIDGRLARSFEGTGLGLPLVKTLVDLHGGRVEIQSALAQGTSVSVLLRKHNPNAVSNAA